MICNPYGNYRHGAQPLTIFSFPTNFPVDCRADFKYNKGTEQLHHKGRSLRSSVMNIIVRGMIQSDVEDLSRAFAAQGWLMPSSVFENCYTGMLKRLNDMLVAEVAGQPAGFARIEWFDAGEETGHALAPEIQEFIVLNRFAGTGVAEAMVAEIERRIAEKTGDIMENVLMAVYGDPPARPPFRYSYVLDGLLVGNEGKLIRVKNPGKAPAGGSVISIKKGNRI